MAQKEWPVDPIFGQREAALQASKREDVSIVCCDCVANESDIRRDTENRSKLGECHAVIKSWIGRRIIQIADG